MIGSHLESRVASWASADAAAVRAVIEAYGATSASPAAVRSGTHGGHW